MKTAVCVKYVPVVSRITFDYEKKTIVRDGVPSEVNPFDVLGLVRAVELKSGPEDEVVAVSMGPPQAREGLVTCMALGADRSVLLSDRALAGSDTLATARALGMVLEREQPDLIVCGRNSADAETGQVGPELAELLGLPHISQVRKLDFRPDDNMVVAERITDEGYQVVECPLPAVVCVTEGVAAETFANRQQMTEAQEKPVEEVTCDQLTDDLSQFGLEGSPTWVEDIRLVEPTRQGLMIEEETPESAAEQVAQLLRDGLASLGTAEDGDGETDGTGHTLSCGEDSSHLGCGRNVPGRIAAGNAGTVGQSPAAFGHHPQPGDSGIYWRCGRRCGSRPGGLRRRPGADP